MGARGKKAKDNLRKQIWAYYSKLLSEGVPKMQAREQAANKFKVGVVTVSRIKRATIGVEPGAIDDALATKYK